MKFTRIILTDRYTFRTLILPVVGAKPSDSFIFQGAEGLGDIGADVSIATTLGRGGLFQGRQPHPRQIVLNIGLNPDYAAGETVESLRRQVYYFRSGGPSPQIKLILSDANLGFELPASIMGVCSSATPALFDQNPGIQFVLECVDPYFVGPTAVNVVTANTNGIAQFAFNYTGDAPTGFDMEFILNSNMDRWKVTDLYGGDTMEVVYPFHAGDTIRINTTPGARRVVLNRGSEPQVNLLPYRAPYWKWLMLHNGQNSWNLFPYDFKWDFLRYTPKYLGA